jgi:hypothetical protein
MPVARRSEFGGSNEGIKELETLIAQRVGIIPHQALSDVLERCESVGKLLRLLVLKLESES